MVFRIVVIFILAFFLKNACIAQDSKGGDPPKHEKSIKSKRKLRKADKKKWKEERRNKRAEEKKIRNHHKRIQTKSVRKRMKGNKGKAIRNNANQREPFFKRLFQKKDQSNPKKKPLKSNNNKFGYRLGKICQIIKLKFFNLPICNLPIFKLFNQLSAKSHHLSNLHAHLTVLWF